MQKYIKMVVLLAYGIHLYSADEHRISSGLKMSSIDKLCKAAQYGEIEKIACLLEGGVDINGFSRNDTRGLAPIHFAAGANQSGALRYLIAKGADINRETDYTKASPICCAISNKSMRAFSSLLDCSQVNLNQQLIDGATPVFLAAQDGLISMVKDLVARGAEADIPRNDNSTPFSVACEFGHVDVVKFLASQGVQVNARLAKEPSPLLKAAAHGYFDIVSYLLTLSDVHVDDPNNANVTPLFIATLRGYELIMCALLKSGADLFVKNVVGENLLHAAVHGDKSGEIIKSLFKIAPRVKDMLHEKNLLGLSPLHYAAQSENLEAARLLIASRISINDRDFYGKTPLFYAAQYGRKSIVKSLLQHGARMDIADKKGEFPIEIARKNNHNDIVVFLEQKIKQKQKGRGCYKKTKRTETGKKNPVQKVDYQKEKIECLLEHKKTERLGKKARGTKINPGVLFEYTNVKDEKETYVVIDQKWHHECKLLLIYKQPMQDMPFLEVDLDEVYRQKDMFHGFDSTVDRYLCYGVKVEDRDSELLRNHSITLPENCYAIVLPGKITNQYYDYYYADKDRHVVDRSSFSGAFVYLFEKNGVCFHRMFHQSNESKAIN